MLDLKRPLRAVPPNGAGKPTPTEYLTSLNGRHLVQLKMNGKMTIWACDPCGDIEERVWRIENVPPEPVVQHCIAFLYNYKGSVCCGMVVSRAALDSFFVNNPGKLLTYKEVSFDYINPDKNF